MMCDGEGEGAPLEEAMEVSMKCEKSERVRAGRGSERQSTRDGCTRKESQIMWDDDGEGKMYVWMMCEKKAWAGRGSWLGLATGARVQIISRDESSDFLDE